MTARTAARLRFALCLVFALLALHTSAQAQIDSTSAKVLVLEERIKGLEKQVQIQQDALEQRESMVCPPRQSGR